MGVDILRTLFGPEKKEGGYVFDPLGNGSGWHPPLEIVVTRGKKKEPAPAGGGVPGLTYAGMPTEADYRGYSGESFLRSYLENLGLNTGDLDIELVPYKKLFSRHGDVQAYRAGNRLEIGSDYRGVEISPYRAVALALHEYFAGPSHSADDTALQKQVEEFLVSVGDKGVLREARNITAQILALRN